MVPVQAESTFAAPAPALTSSTWTVLKSMLKRVYPDVLGTVECRCAPEKRSRPPTLATTLICGSSSTGSSGRGCFRVSRVMC